MTNVREFSTTVCLPLAVAAAMSLGAPPAIAQTDNASVAEGPEESGDIVVTAQRREQSAQDVPISLAVLSGETIERANIQSAKELVSQVSGVLVQDHYGTSTFYVIRGIGLNDLRSNSSPSAAVYLDEVYQGNILAGSPPTYDLERVEVLKGPQGTLYGRNASSGAVNIITRKPTRSFEGYSKISVGRFEHATIKGAVGGPMADTLSFRVAGQYDLFGNSVFRNVSPVPAIRGVTPGEAYAPKSGSVRGQLLWQPSGNTEVLLKVSYGQRSGSTVNTVAVPTLQIPGSPSICPGSNAGPDLVLRGGCQAGLASDIFVIPPTGKRLVSVNFPSKLDAKFWSGTLRVDHDFGWADLVSISAYDGFTFDQRFDFDATVAEGLNVRQESRDKAFSQEFRLSDNRGGISWLVGVNAGSDRYREPVRTFYAGDFIAGERGSRNFIGAPGRVGATSPHYVTRLTDANSVYQTLAQSNAAYAVFTDNEIAITERLSLIVGYRFTYETRKIRGQGFVTFNDGSQELANQFDLGPANGRGKTSTKRSSGRIVLNWRPASNVLTYASLAESFKSGGFDAGFLSNITFLQNSYGPEVVRSAEVGIKAEPLPGLRLNGALFYTDYDNPQARLTFFTPGPGGVQIPQSILGNLDKARVYGAEAEVEWRPFRGLNLSGTATLLDTKVSQSGSGAGTFDGNPLSHAPKQSFTLNGTYQFPLGGGLQGRVQGNMKYVGAHYLRPEALPIDRQSSYIVVDAHVAFGAENGGWELSLWGRNLTDKLYFVDAQVGFGAQRYNVGMPLTWGASGTVRF